jgi:hypothetical protein
MGVSDVNVSATFHTRPGTTDKYIEVCRSKGSTPMHDPIELGKLGDSAVEAGWLAVRDAATSTSAFADELESQFPDAFDLVSAWPLAHQMALFQWFATKLARSSGL